MTKGKGLLSIAAVMVLGTLNSPAVMAQGWAVETMRKTDGLFSTASTTFVPVPGTVIDFVSEEGPAVFSVSATEMPDCLAVSQIGVRLDGVDYPLESNNIHTFAGGVAVLRIGLGGVTFVNPLSAGAHTAEVILRRVDAACGSARVAASAELPLNFVIKYSVIPAGDVGNTLGVQYAPAGDITLSWGASCASDDTDYEIYEGRLGLYYSHAAMFCTTGGATMMTFKPAAASAYYLVVARNELREGSYGRRSGGAQIPQGASACMAQEIALTCP